jgi:archaeal flagellin N-terminal-like domain
MLKTVFNTEDRGQVGIGTLIVFIAMVLVAAIAAGVLINTAGLLQTQAEATGEESTEQVADRLQIQSATGNVDSSVTPTEINYFNLTVTKSPGAGDIQLNETSYQIVTDGAVETGILNSSEVTIANVTSATNDNVITERSDRYNIKFDLNQSSTNITGQGLVGGESVSVTLTTAPGASTVTELRVPDSLVSRSAVSL